MQDNEDMTLKKAGKKFSVTIFTISYWLKKLGCRLKKDFSYLEASQENRDQYLFKTKDIAADNLVYIDENVLDIGFCQKRG